ncbi:JmjC domain-containing protein [Candidatus Palauibacter sp.]|uniref:JmjC domain-containing protein n=1 Tax=Candidatus Palauibacter sp. TaxID=3101350 RepID=UPI003B524FA1
MRRTQGFRPHWDTHDVSVLQVVGSKRWRLYDGGRLAPHVPVPCRALGQSTGRGTPRTQPGHQPARRRDRH